MRERRIIGWDIGGAHVKACVLRAGRVEDVAQWACPLWQGTVHLERALQAARERWPFMLQNGAEHAVTMTGEMVDLFAHREDGVQRIAELLQRELGASGAPLRFFAGDAGWCGADDVAKHWEHIASANWLATARHAAMALDGDDGDGLLVDIGSTTTDLIAFRQGRVITNARTDADRLASGELVYHGVVRTPLCSWARRIPWRSRSLNVMNEYFATAADVYRLTTELDAAHDLYPAADNAAKDLPATRQRLARMIGLDARDASDDEWLAFAQAWRAAQVAELAEQLRRVVALHGLSAKAAIVSAGCGDFLLPDVMRGAEMNGPLRAYRQLLPAASESAATWAQVCAPSVAVAALFERDAR